MRRRCAVSDTLEGEPCQGFGVVEFLGEFLCEHHARQFKHEPGDPKARWEEVMFHVDVWLKNAYRQGSAENVRLLQTARAKAALELHLARQELESKSSRIGAPAACALLAALDAYDRYTSEHSKAVAGLSVAVAREIGFSEEKVAEIEQAALVHDIGKIGVPEAILNKPGPLDDREWALMREHAVIGERIVASIEVLSHLAPVIRTGHERWDGSGYPDGLEGEQIPQASRIISVCDSYEAMISNRPYHRAIGVQAALVELERNAGTQFCPYTVQAFTTVLRCIRAGDYTLGGGEP
jgi:putative nucleotidyltransferase with HDIG domain